MSVSIIVISDKEELDAPQVVEVSCNNENDFIEEKEQNAYENEGLSVKAIKYPLEEASHYFEEFCYICRSEVNFENEGNFFNALDTSIRTQHSKQPIVDALTKILGICIKSGIGSLFVCQNCFLIMNRWDEFQIKAEKYQNILKGKHGNAPSVSSFIQEQRCHQDEFDSFENRPIPHGPSMSTLSLNLSLEEQGISPSDPEYLPYNYQSKKIKQRGRGVRKNVLKVGHNHQRELLCQPNSMLNKLVSNEKENSANLDKDLQSNCAFQHPSNRLNKHQPCNNGKNIPLRTKRSYKTKLHRCQLCSKEFEYASEVREHLKSYNSAQECSTCGKKVLKVGMMLQHQAKFHGFPLESNLHHKCWICNRIYQSKSALSYHLATNHNVKNHQCPHCQQKFTHTKNLLAHIKRHGEKEKACHLCSAKFYTTSELGYHVNAVHKNARCWRCPICNIDFNRSSSFHRHKEKHRPKRFQCTICNKRFRRKSYAMQHLKLHPPEESSDRETKGNSIDSRIKELIYCERCGKMFEDKSSHESHECINQTGYQ